MIKSKKVILSITIVLLLIAVVSASTYAYFVSRSEDVNFGSSTGEVDIIYDARENINNIDRLIPVLSKEKGIISVVEASLGLDSVKSKLNLYLTPTVFSNELNIEVLKWDVVINDKEGNYITTYSGNFLDASLDTPMKVVDSYLLSTDKTVFNIYVWLDAKLITNNINENNFKFKISSDIVNITADF